MFIAAIFLHEKIKLHNLFITLIGFGGILLITHLGGRHFGVTTWVALAGAGLGATMMVINRVLTFSDSNEVMMTYPAVATVIATSLPTWLGWVSPTLPEFFYLLLISYTGILGQWCLIQAFRLGETTIVAPVSYIRIVYASLLGAVFFSEIPDIMTVTGSIVIIISNLILVTQERRIYVSNTRKRVPGDVT